MKYVALLTGQGEGCDYTIGCNKNFIVFEANGYDEAILICKEKWDDMGGANAYPPIKNIQLFQVCENIHVPTADWEKAEKNEAKDEIEKELSELEKKAGELRSKLGGFTNG